MEAIKKLLSGELKEYRSIPFWSWNSHLEIPALLAQIRDMKAAGVGGFIMHARTGLRDEYLGEHWMQCVGACLEEARKLDMEAWLYDENGWPSGFVGGALLEREEFRARYLEYGVGGFDASAYAVFVSQGEGFRRVDGPVAGQQEYHNIYLRVSPANTDILNPAVVEAFIRQTHEAYYARFPQSFGRELAGFFTDEPQFYRWATPYTPWAEPYFADIRDGLIWLFVDSPLGWPFRSRYYRVLNDLYTHNFYKKLYDWCEDHGCKLTGHSVEETALFGQMWGGGAVMPSYEFEHMPGIDALGNWNTEELAPKQVSSAAAQLGKRFVLTETFGCAGHNVTPPELRSIAEAQYFQGVNRMCQHLYPYSLAGQGKVDHPPVFGPQGNWGQGFREFNDYFAKLGCLVANTQEQVDVAILHPQRDIWLRYIRSRDYDSVARQEDRFEDLLKKTLRKAGVTYHFLDETLLERHGSIEEGFLRVGRQRYETVLVPQMDSLAASTYQLLKQFAGRLCVLGDITCLDGAPAAVELKGNLTLDELLEGKMIPFSCEDGRSFVTCRTGEAGEFLFIKNLSQTEESRVTLETAQDYRALDLESLTLAPVSREMTLKPNGSDILLRTQAPAEEQPECREKVTDRFRVTGISENYLVLDYARIARGDGPFTDKAPIPGLMEGLLRQDYRGELTVEQRFYLEEAMPLTLLMEKTELLDARLNGKPLEFAQSGFDVNFLEADIGSLVQPGENVFTYRFRFWQHEGVRFALFDPLATESLRNCLYYDTTLENTYLRGDFTVGENHSLRPRKTLPGVSAQLHKAGWPFFMGTVDLEGSLTYSGGPAVLELAGAFQSVQVTANGKSAWLVLDHKKDIRSLLTRGENRVRLRLYSSLRNLLGPHHFAPAPDPQGAVPDYFTHRGQWNGGLPKTYTHTHHSAPFGVDDIFLWRKENL